MAERPGSHDFVYVHTDIPEGMTIREWRRERAAARHATRQLRRRRLLATPLRRWITARRVPFGIASERLARRSRGSRMRRRALTAATFVLVAASVAVAVMEGVPSRLPGVALGSPVLLGAERALALLAVTVAALSVAVQAARGRLPLELSTSGLRYEAEVVDDAAAAVADVQAQLDDLALFVVELAERLDALSRHP